MLLLAAAPFAAACGTSREAPPHVLLVVIDTLRADHLRCYGYSRETSPYIDQLAAQGARFETVIAQCSWTGPSMVSMLTGRELAGERLSVPAGLPTLAEAFLAAGFRTGAFVVNPLVHNPENGFRRGFEHFEDQADPLEIRSWLLETDGRPTYTYVHWVDPHDPYGPEEGYHHFLRRGDGVDSTTAEWYRSLAEREALADVEEGIELIGRALDGYDDDVRLVDAKLGVLLLALRRVGVLDDSVVVVASDHGEGLWTHPTYPRDDGTLPERTLSQFLFARHGTQAYEELLRVPLIVFAPSVVPTTVVRQPVRNVDILPTIAELAGIAPFPEIDGHSLLPHLVDGAPPPGRDAVAITGVLEVLRTADGWKLMRPTSEGRARGLRTELYNLHVDPRERRNLADERLELVLELGARLDARVARGLPTEGDREPTEGNLQALRALGYLGDEDH